MAAGRRLTPGVRRTFMLATAVLGTWLAYTLVERSPPAAPAPTELPPEIADEPDLYIEQALITQFQHDGRVRYRLVADRVRHFESSHLTRLTDPAMSLHNAEQPPWNVAARHGYIRQRQLPGRDSPSEVVYLRDEVEMTQTDPTGRFIRLTSPSMYLYPDDEYAETDQDVIIDTDSGRTQAAGVRANLNLGRLQLTSDADQRVHTIILPDQMK